MRRFCKKRCNHFQSKPSKNFSWIGSFTDEDLNKAFYNAIRISNQDYSCQVIYTVGDTVLFNSLSQIPFIAEIDSFYEEKSSGKKYVVAKWFYRVSDIKAYSKQLLDNISNIISSKYDVFLCDSLLDPNSLDSILRPCHVIYHTPPTDNLYDEHEEDINAIIKNIRKRDTFICRYRFDPHSGKVLPLCEDELGRLRVKKSSNILMGAISSINQGEFIK